MINRVVTVNLDKIRELAKKKNLSITRLEEELHFSNGTICKWKDTGASSNSLYIVAKFLGVSSDDLLEVVVEERKNEI